jgi:Glycerophosphoryl diester phosphodiesterase family
MRWPLTASRQAKRVRPTTLALTMTSIVLAVLLVPVVWDRLQLQYGWGLPQRVAPPMQIVAHRGDLDRFPEDTAESILAAAAMPVDGIEFDVHRSADGVWFVIHDATLDRTTDGIGAISELPASVIDVATIDGGLGFRPGGERMIVPRLEAVLAGLRDFDGLIYVDLQHARDAPAVELAHLLAGRHAAILCRSPGDARAIRAVDPSILTIARRGSEYRSEVSAWLMEAVGEATVGTIARAELPVVVYVDPDLFNEDEWPAFRRAWSAGVMAFISKHPRRALELRARAFELATWIAR